MKDEPPRRKRPRDEEEEPRRPRSRNDDEDEDERPRRRRADASEDEEPRRRKKKKKSSGAVNVRNRVMGGIGVVWGILVLISCIVSLRSSTMSADYRTGVIIALCFGVFLVGAGLYYVLGFRD